MKKIILNLIVLILFSSVTLTQVAMPAQTVTQLKEATYGKEVVFSKMELVDAAHVLGYIYSITLSVEESLKTEKVSLTLPEKSSAYDAITAIEKQLNIVAVDNSGVIQFRKTADSLKDAEAKADEKQVLTGEVLNYYGKPVSNASIKVGDSENLTGVSNAYGQYKIPNVPAGGYIVRVTADNYRPAAEIITMSSKNQKLNISIGKPIVRVTNITTESGINRELGVVKDSEGNLASTKILYINNSDISGVNKIITELLPKIKTIIDEKNSLIILKGSENDLKTAVLVAENLDRNIKQVLIKAKIVDMSKNASQELGFDWSALGSSEAFNILGGTNLTSGLIPPIGQLGFIFQRGGFSGSVGLLSSIDESNIMSEPNIMVVNGEQATIAVTEERKVGETITTDTDTGNVTKTPLYKDAGTTLIVTPFIKNDGSIVLEISTNVSSFTNTNSSTDTSAATEVGTKTSDAKTKVRLKNGEKLIIGGLERKEELTSDQKVPMLSDIPIFGIFFKHKKTQHITRKIYIEITPEIISLN